MTGGSTDSSPRVFIEVLPHGEGLPMPTYGTAMSVGADLPSSIDVLLAPGARALVPTGFIMHLPEGWEAQLRPRSGLALNHGITVLNTPGTVDADYRGEIKVLLINLGDEPFQVTRGMRCAQMIIAPAHQAVFEKGTRGETMRGANGFGSTGL